MGAEVGRGPLTMDLDWSEEQLELRAETVAFAVRS